MKTNVLIIIVCSFFLGQITPLQSEEHPGNKPGLQTQVPCVEDPTYTLRLYFPKAYAADPERIFPALFVSNSSGKWLRIKRFIGWAE